MSCFVLLMDSDCFTRGNWTYCWYDIRLVLYFIRLRFPTSVSGIITIKIGLILQPFLGTLHILRFTVQALHSNYLLSYPGLKNTSKLDHNRVKHLSTINSFEIHTHTHTHILLWKIVNWDFCLRTNYFFNWVINQHI